MIKKGKCFSKRKKKKVSLRTSFRYGLAWSPHKSNSNHLLSAGFDGRICQWDVDGTTRENRVLEPVRIYTAHTSVEVMKSQNDDTVDIKIMNKGCCMAYKI